jgi:hypothetical protein
VYNVLKVNYGGNNFHYHFFDQDMRPVYLDVSHYYDSWEKIHKYWLTVVLEGSFEEANLEASDFLIPQCPSRKVQTSKILAGVASFAKNIPK